MTHGDNPAARLAAFVKPLRSHQASSANAAEHFAAGWGLQWPRDVSKVLRRLADVCDLAHQTREIANGLPPDASASLLLEHFGQVETVVNHLAQASGLQLRQLLSSMQDTGWHSLDLADDLLRRYRREPVLRDDDVQRLRKMTRELIDAVSDADDLDAEVKMWLLAKLRDVRTALENVEITGYYEVERATDSALGGLRRNVGILARLGESKTLNGVVTLLTALNLALTTAEGAWALTARSSDTTKVEVVIQQITGAPPAATSNDVPAGTTGADREDYRDVVDAEVLEDSGS